MSEIILRQAEHDTGRIDRCGGHVKRILIGVLGTPHAEFGLRHWAAERDAEHLSQETGCWWPGLFAVEPALDGTVVVLQILISVLLSEADDAPGKPLVGKSRLSDEFGELMIWRLGPSRHRVTFHGSWLITASVARIISVAPGSLEFARPHAHAPSSAARLAA